MNYINELKKIERKAETAIVDLFHLKGVSGVPVGNCNGKYDDLVVFAFNDDVLGADAETLKYVRVENGVVTMECDNGRQLSRTDVHEGTMPYIYAAVEERLRDMPDMFINENTEIIIIRKK